MFFVKIITFIFFRCFVQNRNKTTIKLTNNCVRARPGVVVKRLTLLRLLNEDAIKRINQAIKNGIQFRNTLHHWWCALGNTYPNTHNATMILSYELFISRSCDSQSVRRNTYHQCGQFEHACIEIKMKKKKKCCWTRNNNDRRVRQFWDTIITPTCVNCKWSTR